MNQVEIKRKQAQVVSTILALITLAVVARLTGYNGAAYIAAAVEAVTLAWLVAAENLSDVLGRLLRSRNARGQQKNAARLRRNALLFQAVLGLAGSLVLLVGADWIARSVFRVQYCTFILMVMSPVVFLRTLSSVMLGYFQGEGAELPTAASGILRQIFILGFSLLFGRMLSEYGGKVSRLLVQENFTSMYGGVGVGIAVSVTELFIVIFLFLIYRGSRRFRDRQVSEGMRAVDSFADSVRILCSARGLQWVTGLLIFLPVPLGFIFLTKSGELDYMATAYGIYVSGYWVLCGIWTAFIMLSLIPVCGRTMIYLRKEELRFARAAFQSGFHVGMVHAAFASAFITVMAPQLAQVFCTEQAKAAEDMLQGGGLVVLFLALALYFGRFLNLSGGKLMVLGAMGVVDVVYVLSVTVMLNTGQAGVQALIYGGVLGSGVACVLLGALACRQMRLRPDWLQLLVVPAGAACVAGLIGMLFGRVLTPNLGSAVTLIVVFVVCCALYWAVLLLLRNFREQELETIPGGRLIHALGQMLRVF